VEQACGAGGLRIPRSQIGRDYTPDRRPSQDAVLSEFETCEVNEKQWLFCHRMACLYSKQDKSYRQKCEAARISAEKRKQEKEQEIARLAAERERQEAGKVVTVQ
jgi:elongation factor P hydroxylase